MHLDTIVIGTGGVGSAALFHLARRGARVLGIDRFPPGHDRGSSHGETRIIRLAYMEHPDYVPLLRRAYELWAELEERRERKLYHQTGLLQVGPRGGAVVTGVLRSAREHGLDVEEFEPREAEKRFPGFRVPESMSGVFERGAGYLRVEDCVRAHFEEAKKAGAEARIGEEIQAWRPEGSGFAVSTDRESYSARSLVVSAGAWTAELLGDLGASLEVRRKSLFWYETGNPAYAAENGCPAFLYETPAGIFYGFPRIDELGLKVAEHTGGRQVSEPLKVDRELDSEEEGRARAFLSDHLPDVGDRLNKHEVCLYTMTPDEHFTVDRHPRHPGVVFAAGLSGHGFKFTSVLGEVLADLALEGKTRMPIEFLGCQRFAS